MSMMMSASNIIAPNNLGPIINVVQWTFMACMLTVVLVKSWDRWARKRGLCLDDYLVLAAAISAIGQTVASSFQVYNGQGQPSQLVVDSGHLEALEKATYVCGIFYILTLMLAKLSTAVLLQMLAPITWAAQTMKIYAIIVCLWGPSTLVAYVFRCDLPEPWILTAPSQCIQQIAFWITFGAMDALTDALLVIIPSILVLNLNSALRKRVSVVFYFGVRIFCIPLSIVRIVYIEKSLASGQLKTQGIVVALATDIQTHVVVILACVPLIKSVVHEMYNGVLTSDIITGPARVRPTRETKRRLVDVTLRILTPRATEAVSSSAAAPPPPPPPAAVNAPLERLTEGVGMALEEALDRDAILPDRPVGAAEQHV